MAVDGEIEGRGRGRGEAKDGLDGNAETGASLGQFAKCWAEIEVVFQMKKTAHDWRHCCNNLSVRESGGCEGGEVDVEEWLMEEE